MANSSTTKTRRRPVRAAEVRSGERVSKQPSQDDGEIQTISASHRATFKRCRYQWHFPYMRNLEPKVSAPALRFGTLVHAALEHYYKPGVRRGPHPAETFQIAYAQEFGQAQTLGFKDEDGKWGSALELGVDMLEHYVDHYGKEDEWRVLATEQVFEQPVYYPGTDIQVGKYVGVLDLVLEHRPTTKIWIRDHKTTSTIDTSYLAMDDQSSGYWTFGGDWLKGTKFLKPGQELTGIQFNFLRKAKRDTRPKNANGHFLNQDGSVSAKQPPEFFKRFPSFRGEAEREHTRFRVAKEIEEIMLVKREVLAMLKTPDKMNCKFCAVRDICELHEIGADWQEMMRMIMRARVPQRERKLIIEFEHEH